MDKYELIQLWSLGVNNRYIKEIRTNICNYFFSSVVQSKKYNKNIKFNYYTITDKILDKCKSYFIQNKIELVHLHKLNNNDFNFWTICSNSGIIYLIKLVFNQYNNINDSKYILSKINRYTYKELVFNLTFNNTIKQVNIFNDLINKYCNFNLINIYTKTINDILLDTAIFQLDLNCIVQSSLLYNIKTPIIDSFNISKNITYNLQNKKRKQLLDNIYPAKRIRLTQKTNVNLPSKNLYVHDNFFKPIFHFDWDNMISASSIRNYMLSDPLLDYLAYYNIKSSDDNLDINNDYESTDTFTKYILNAGIEIELASDVFISVCTIKSSSRSIISGSSIISATSLGLGTKTISSLQTPKKG